MPDHMQWIPQSKLAIIEAVLELSGYDWAAHSGTYLDPDLTESCGTLLVSMRTKQLNSPPLGTHELNFNVYME